MAAATRSAVQSTKKEKQDESIMQTNSSCIVSKRCVEKIYFGKDDGFLRCFVPKFQRRSPLISRGYWLRMRVIQGAISSFLRTRGNRPAVIVNLGCGFDTLPFEFLTENATLCEHATFVDVDYPSLMAKKVQVIKQTEKLSEVLGSPLQSPHYPDHGAIRLESAKYMALACDLEKTDELDKILRQRFTPSQDSFLFLAEVSMTYMDQFAASHMIRWTSTFEQSTFCLLEQYLPDGSGHPFAKTMLSHFDKLNSPLKSARAFPSLKDQKRRFSTFDSWKQVEAESLWSLWARGIVSASEKQSLNQIEPFDEWEEFAMFASHYFLLVASTQAPNLMHQLALRQAPSSTMTHDAEVCCMTSTSRLPVQRRFGASAMLTSDTAIVHGGHGLQGRTDTNIIFRSRSYHSAVNVASPKVAIGYHTLTPIDDGLALMVGGRASPDRASAECFLVGGDSAISVAPLPHALYRHCAVRVRLGASAKIGVVVFGGKLDSGRVSDSWLLWNGQDWTNLPVKIDTSQLPNQTTARSVVPEARFGACMVTGPNDEPSGFLLGGMAADTSILLDLWKWEIVTDGNSIPTSIRCHNATEEAPQDSTNLELYRMGASIARAEQRLIIVGGISAHGTIKHQNEMLVVDEQFRTIVGKVSLSDESQRLMLIGAGVIARSDAVSIIGGGAVCFSFGAFWNDRVRHLDFSRERKPDGWVLQPDHSSSRTHSPRTRASSGISGSVSDTNSAPRSQYESLVVPRHRLCSAKDFQSLLQEARPAILTNCSLGPCTSHWTLDYLRSKVPADLAVAVHDSPTPNMDFLSKNFAYKTIPFAALLESIEDRAHVYMRAVSLEKASEKPTTLIQDWPWLAEDFKLPAELVEVTENSHSSVLRLSGPVTMWLHYDVMANVLCQIQGEKTLILYPPKAVSALGFPAGASSSHLNPFVRGKEPPKEVERYKAKLKPGDVLFIPPFWAHAAAPTDGLSIAVNVFFRDLERGKYAAGKDVYGNRDLAAYENGRNALQRIVGGFKGLPSDAKAFYLQRLADELHDTARKANATDSGRL